MNLKSFQMAPDNNNWLSFSLSSMEMLNSSSSQSSNMLQSADSNHYYFADNNFFPHGKHAMFFYFILLIWYSKFTAFFLPARAENSD